MSEGGDHNLSMNTVARTAALLFLAAMAACTSTPRSGAAPAVHTLGANANFGKGDFASYANLAEFRHTPHLYALGPVQHLGGEVLVLDSEPYAVEVSEGRLRVTSSWEYAPPFLVHSQVAHWRELPVPEEVQTFAQLEDWIGKAAVQSGLEADQPFAFKLRARPVSLTVTVMNRPASAIPGDKPLREYQTSWQIGGHDTDFVGFHSTRHAGIFLGNAEKVHIHAITQDRKLAGHVQELQLARGAKLYLPEIR